MSLRISLNFIIFLALPVYHTLNVDPFQSSVGRQDVAVVHPANGRDEEVRIRHQRHRPDLKGLRVDLEGTMENFGHILLVLVTGLLAPTSLYWSPDENSQPGPQGVCSSSTKTSCRPLELNRLTASGEDNDKA